MIGKVAAHGVVGGAMSEGMGGDFQSGFMAAAFTQAVSLSGAFDKLAADPTTAAGRFKNAVAAAVVGGTASVVGGGKFANGAITGAFSRLFNDLLEFDGEALFWKDDDGKVLNSWPAVSGAPGSSPDDMYTKVGFGPIPQGDYTVDPAATNHWGPIKALRDWGNVDDWGFSRTQIVPKPGTFQGFRKAGSMYLHGGSRPGSAGCIDLTRYNGHFHSYLRSYGKPVDLVVKYKNWVPTPF